MSTHQGSSGIHTRQRAAGGPRVTHHVDLVNHTLRNGEYKIDAVLGHGGMARVFLATHTTLQIPLALKQGQADQPVPEVVVEELERILHSDTTLRHSLNLNVTEDDFPTSGGVHTDRFIREALLLARLQHASLPALYDYFLEDGYWYLVMDYIPGPTLSAYIHKNAPLPTLEALNYAMQLCDVLEYLHKQTPPVIFRDLKPSNIILSPDGRVMLVDFGIARYFKAGQMNDTTEFGSPGYAPPEQYQGGSQTDGRSDLYSLGVILHEMISGKRPIGMGGKLESLHYINPAISSALSGLVTVSTRTEPLYRFQSAHAFYSALERAYSIEERRAYQQKILTVEHSPTDAQWSTLPLFSAQDEELLTPLLPAATQLKQRQHTREILQEARREHVEQERAEIHLASIDLSLEHRSSMGISSKSLPSIDIAELEDDFEPLPPVRKGRRFAKVFFVLALIIFLILASFNLASFFTKNTSSNNPALSPTRNGTTQTPLATASTPLHSSWQILPSLPSAAADNTAVYIQLQQRAYIYVSGGFRGSTQVPQYDHNLYRYDVTAAHWETLTNTHFPAMGNNAAALDEHNEIFFTSGYSPDVNTLTSLLYKYQPGTGILQKIVPPPQVTPGFGAAMIADQQGHLYLTQGFMKIGDPLGMAGTGWYRYDIASGQWHVLAPLPVGLGYVVLAPDGADNILLLGGAKDAGQNLISKQVYRYNSAQDAWTTVQTTVPAALSGASSCLNGPGQLVIVGGYNPSSTASFNQAWLVDLHTFHWTALAALPYGGSLLGTATCDGNGHVYLTRGASDPSRPTPDFLELTIMGE